MCQEDEETITHSLSICPACEKQRQSLAQATGNARVAQAMLINHPMVIPYTLRFIANTQRYGEISNKLWTNKGIPKSFRQKGTRTKEPLKSDVFSNPSNKEKQATILYMMWLLDMYTNASSDMRQCITGNKTQTQNKKDGDVRRLWMRWSITCIVRE